MTSPHPTQRTVRGSEAVPSTPRARTARRGVAFAAVFTALLVATGCTAPIQEAPASGPESAMLTEHGLDGLDARGIIESLDMMPLPDRSNDLMASIRPKAIELSDGHGHKASVPLPEGEFYVSVAPYVEQTHDCYFHSLTTCVGELQGQDVAVTVTDTDTGEVLLDETRTTYDNGFFGLWLPRDIRASITISHDGRSVTAPLATSDDDPTCVTTLQLT